MEKNEQTNETDEAGKGTDSKDEKDKPISIVEEARAIRDEILKARDELKEEKEGLQKVQSENLLSGTSGGHVESIPISPEQKITKQAEEFFKDTALGDAIKKTNE